MILPGLISAAFYRRRPGAVQISLGLVFTVVLSGLLGYIQDAGTSRVWENVAIAIVGGIILYAAILAYLVYWYFPKRAMREEPQAPSPSAPPH
jgi:hypothetical protein